jgi:hypothetical protein
LILTLPFAGKADTSFTITNTTADAFLSGASPALNFGSAGTVAIAPASSAKGEFNSVIKFNFAGAASQFNTTYGAGNWQITGLTLSLASNTGTQGAQPGNAIFNTINAGSFGIDWLGYDGWTEGTGGGNGAANGAVSFNSISTLFSAGFSSLGAFTYTPPGNNVYLNYSLPLAASLVSDATAGGDVSLYFFAADNQVGYLFNSREFASAHPNFTITAAPVPEPDSLALTSALFGALLALWKRTKTK